MPIHKVEKDADALGIVSLHHAIGLLMEALVDVNEHVSDDALGLILFSERVFMEPAVITL